MTKITINGTNLFPFSSKKDVTNIRSKNEEIIHLNEGGYVLRNKNKGYIFDAWGSVSIGFIIPETSIKEIL